MNGAPILVVDDNPDNLKLVLRFLGAKGYRVIGASNTAEADAVFASEEPRTVFIDVSLPGEDGLSWVRRVRARNDVAAGVRFVALTANTSPEARDRARDAGCDEFLTKPVPLKALLDLVQRSEMR